jgi:LPS-assembly protein
MKGISSAKLVITDQTSGEHNALKGQKRSEDFVRLKNRAVQTLALCLVALIQLGVFLVIAPHPVEATVLSGQNTVLSKTSRANPVPLHSSAPTENQVPIQPVQVAQSSNGVRVQSDSLDYDKTGRLATARGNVVITQKGYQLTAHKVTYDKDTKKITASGNVRLREPDGNIVRATYMEITDDFAEGFGRNLRFYFINQARLEATTSERSGGNITVLNDAMYTRCEKCKKDPTKPLVWQIKAKKITHDQKARELQYEKAKLEFFGTPVLYVPKFSHPDPTVKRKTGFLIPGFSYSSFYGAGVETPYFWNIAPNKDITFAPLVTSKKGPLLKAEWRHRTQNGHYTFAPTGIYELTKSKGGVDRHRGSIHSEGSFNINRDWEWGWDGVVTSDDTYLRRYKIDNRSDLISTGWLRGLNGRNYFNAQAYHFRGVLSNDDPRTTPLALPVIDHDYTFDQSVWGGEFGVNSSAYSLQRREGVDTTRLVSTLHWKRQLVTDSGILITPFSQLRGDIYFEDNVSGNSSDTIARILPTAGLDLRWPLISIQDNGQHTFEPVGQIVARTNETDANKISNEDAQSFIFDDSNLFAIDKFSGDDRWAGGVRANLGFNYTWQMDSARYLRVTAGQSYHLSGKNSYVAGSGLDTDASDFVAAMYLQLNENLIASTRFQFNEDSLDITRQETALQASYDRFKISIGYNDLKAIPALGRTTRGEEILASASYRFTDHWRIIGGMRYDIDADRQVENVIGFGYEDECFSFELRYIEDFINDRDIETERSVGFQFKLKTIGGGGLNTGL